MSGKCENCDSSQSQCSTRDLGLSLTCSGRVMCQGGEPDSLCMKMGAWLTRVLWW